MSSDISLFSLSSRLIREKITTQLNGSRLLSGINNLATSIQNQNNPSQAGNGNWLTKIGGALTSFLGGIGSIATTAWGWIVGATNFIWNFNWNATDQQLDAQISDLKTMLAGYLGATLGNLAGWTLCGLLPSAAIFYFNEPLGLKLFEEVGEEALDELAGNLSSLIKAYIAGKTKQLFINTYKNTRKFLKFLYSDPKGWLYNYTMKVNPEFINTVAKWGEQGSQPWSFASWKEEKLEAIKDTAEQNFWEEFWDELGDGCIEAGYVVAGGIDSWILQQQMERESAQGEERTVEILPNRDNEEERIILHGNESSIRTAIPLILANHNLVENRDIGAWVGNTVEEAVKATNNDISIQLKIHLSNAKQPPFNVAGEKKKRVIITVPNADKSKMDWDKIKLAVGGENGYYWGKYFCKARLNTQHNLQLYASSEAEGEERIKALLELSNSKLSVLNITELIQNEGNRQTIQSLRHDPVKIYPISCTIINRVKSLNENAGIATNSGVYERRKFNLPLWTATKPDNWEEAINELFYIQGPNTL